MPSRGVPRIFQPAAGTHESPAHSPWVKGDCREATPEISQLRSGWYRAPTHFLRPEGTPDFGMEGMAGAPVSDPARWGNQPLHAGSETGVPAFAEIPKAVQRVYA